MDEAQEIWIPETGKLLFRTISGNYEFERSLQYATASPLPKFNHVLGGKYCVQRIAFVREGVFSRTIVRSLKFARQVNTVRLRG